MKIENLVNLCMEKGSIGFNDLMKECPDEVMAACAEDKKMFSKVVDKLHENVANGLSKRTTEMMLMAANNIGNIYLPQNTARMSAR